MLFEGAAVAIVTPFNSDLSVNYERLKQLINMQIKEGISAIIVCGTTGESSALTLEEKKKIIKFSVDTANKKVPIIAGTGSNNTESSIYLSKYAEEVGADGVLVVTPYYNKCNQEGLFNHYLSIANSISIPVIIYNVPSRTCVDISVDTIVKLSKVENIVGIKEASTDLVKIAEIISKTDENFAVYSGNDNLTLPILALGGKGVISVVCNIMPKKMQFLCNSYFNGNIIQARKTHLEMLDIMNNLFIDVNPIPIKEAMNTLGYSVGPLRLPLTKLSTEKYATLSDSIQEQHLDIVKL